MQDRAVTKISTAFISRLAKLRMSDSYALVRGLQYRYTMPAMTMANSHVSACALCGTALRSGAEGCPNADCEAWSATPDIAWGETLLSPADDPAPKPGEIFGAHIDFPEDWPVDPAHVVKRMAGA